LILNDLHAKSREHGSYAGSGATLAIARELHWADGIRLNNGLELTRLSRRREASGDPTQLSKIKYYPGDNQASYILSVLKYEIKR
jgi:hypothetical protein